jgi:protein-S-isoprenylcysteine O-methyltransferase Ste14
MFTFVIVPWEERDLEARFGEAYRAYKARVPRWLGLPRSAAIFILLEAARRY